ncbi:MAG TPA: hypothetical protein VFL90_19680 [Methylomirabilota bacterium]|nr:hypothetical protein [Methylomirabilota bacterium]
MELLLRSLAGMALASAFVLTLAWGYGQRQQALAWRELACADRVANVVRQAPFLARGDEPRDACQRLEVLGLGIRADRPFGAALPTRGDGT